jgi:hypothetical protein
VQLLCQCTHKATAFPCLQTYNRILCSPTIERYLDYCDQLWKISEFNMVEKLEQLNMHNRIDVLPKSSQYYLDISTLTDARITLCMGGS